MRKGPGDELTDWLCGQKGEKKFFGSFLAVETNRIVDRYEQL